jgi:FtsH-binding integral membrane protein
VSPEAEGLRLRQWTLMYVGGVVSLAFCVYVVYIVTASGDPSIEWVFWIFFGLTIALIGGGYYLESDHKRRHGDPRLSDYEELFKQEG